MIIFNIIVEHQARYLYPTPGPSSAFWNWGVQINNFFQYLGCPQFLSIWSQKNYFVSQKVGGPWTPRTPCQRGPWYYELVLGTKCMNQNLPNMTEFTEVSAKLFRYWNVLIYVSKSEKLFHYDLPYYLSKYLSKYKYKI